MVNRSIYLEKITPFIGKPVIKVITGMRRVGKSVFLKQIADYLEQNGTSTHHIIYIDKESLEFDHIKNYKDLSVFINEKRQIQGKKILCIDEIQEIKEWEKAIASFQGENTFDIYIAGSNAHLLSSDLATLLSGRYVPVYIYPLSLPEFSQFYKKPGVSENELFQLYIKYGGLPGLHHLEFEDRTVYQFLGAIYNTIVIKDIVHRHHIRNIRLLEDITAFVFDNIGNILSSKKIRDYLKSRFRTVTVDSVLDYLTYLCEAFVLYKVQRYDIKGKHLLDVYEKYYMGDIGLRHALLGYREADISGLLENLVFLELLRQDYTVHIGKIEEKEVDFIARKQSAQCYIQVCYLLESKETLERELSPFEGIKDNFPKYILSMDTLGRDNFQGIQRINILDFLFNRIGL